jgi:predicted alpha/beta hydrolase family esterase
MPCARRVDLGEWERPTRAQWVSRLDAAVAACEREPLIVAHSLGATAVLWWAALRGRRAHAAFLVAPPDMTRLDLPPEVRPFGDPPASKLPFRAAVAASTTDPFCTIERARVLAIVAGAEFFDLGDAGHVNAASGHGPWPAGERILAALRAATRSLASRG